MIVFADMYRPYALWRTASMRDLTRNCFFFQTYPHESSSSEGEEGEVGRTGGNLSEEQLTTPASDHAAIPSQGEDATLALSPATDHTDADSLILGDNSYAGQGEGFNPENQENLPPTDQPLLAESDSSLGEGAVGGQGDDTNRENPENFPRIGEPLPEELFASLGEGAVGGHRDEANRGNPPTGPLILFSNTMPFSN